MNLKLKRTPGIYLVGFMGCGKTTIGRMYAEEIGWRFVDLDDEIEARQRCTISELFDTFGEAEFRRMESEAMLHRVNLIRRGMPTVLALGGGAFTRENNMQLLHDNGTTVWIDTDFPIIERRVAQASHRPLARDPEKFQRLFHDRQAFYRRAEYHVRVQTDDSRAAVQQLLALDLLD